MKKIENCIPGNSKTAITKDQSLKNDSGLSGFFLQKEIFTGRTPHSGFSELNRSPLSEKRVFQAGERSSLYLRRIARAGLMSRVTVRMPVARTPRVMSISKGVGA